MKPTPTLILVGIAAGLLILMLVVSLAVSRETVDPAPLEWQPARLETAAPTLTNTPGWWGEMPTPAPVRTPTPTQAGTLTNE